MNLKFSLKIRDRSFWFKYLSEKLDEVYIDIISWFNMNFLFTNKEIIETVWISVEINFLIIITNNYQRIYYNYFSMLMLVLNCLKLLYLMQNNQSLFYNSWCGL